MAVCEALTRISIRDKNGTLITFNKGDNLEIPTDEAINLEKDKVVKIISIDEGNNFETYPTIEELKVKKKDELIEYANSLGLELSKSMKNEIIMNEILNRIQENQDLED